MRILTWLCVIAVVLAVASCGKPNPLRSTPTSPGGNPNPNPNPNPCVQGTRWTRQHSACLYVSPTNRIGEMSHMVFVPSSPNAFRDTVWIDYSDPTDQDIRLYLKPAGSSTINLVRDSTGRDIIQQPRNYTGRRQVSVTAYNLPPGTYQYIGEYLGSQHASQAPAESITPKIILWRAGICPRGPWVGIPNCP